jgi:putative flippase GtrA
MHGVRSPTIRNHLEPVISKLRTVRAGRVGRFLLVGLLSTGVQYLVLFTGVEAFDATAVRSSGIGFACGAAVNYLLNRSFTFGSSVPHITGLFRFALVVAVGLTLNVLFMYLLTGYLGWHYLLAQILTTGVVMFWNFVGNALWTFRER